MKLTLSQPLKSKMYSVAFKLYHPIGRALTSFIIVFYENCFFNISIRILCTQNFFAWTIIVKLRISQKSVLFLQGVCGKWSPKISS